MVNSVLRPSAQTKGLSMPLDNETTKSTRQRCAVFKAMTHDIAAPYIWSNAIAKYDHMAYHRIKYLEKERPIVCQIAFASDNFKKAYNAPDTTRCKLPNDGCFLVMSEHFRNLLNVPEPKSNNDRYRNFTIEKLPYSWLTLCTAIRYVPDPYVRYSIMLGFVGIVVGVIGVFIGIVGLGISLLSNCNCR